MKWLNVIIGNLLSRLGLDLESRLGGSLQFFFYDVIKIFILLSVLIFGISYIQSYFPPERTKQILSKLRGISANIFAALLGTVTPFCSCSSIPLFIGFTSAGLPVGITFSFLISSPLVDLGSLILITSIFGLQIAVAYVIVGLVLAVLGGLLIEKMGMEAYVEDFIRSAPAIDLEAESLTRRDRIIYAKEQLASTIKKVAPYIFVGVGIGTAIHNFIPTRYVEALLGGSHWYSVPLATLVGVPMYADIFGAIPVAESLFAKGAGLGTVLSFMMAVTALSLPSLIMLRKAGKPKLLFTFTVIVTIGIIFIGYLFNACTFMF
ncbi:permease [Anaerotignum lactatifermentans]|uniref:permease n=1 Tax=Anaerotignum lactatifermentans TaxID=160404 RepID=UPI0030803C67